MSIKSKNLKGIVMFIIISLVLIILAFTPTADYSKGKTPVEATVVSVERNNKKPHWYAKYTVNGTEYTSLINGNANDLDVGKKLTLYYDENNPSQIWHNVKQGNAILARSIIIGFPVIIFILIFIKPKISKKKRKQLNKNKELQQYQNPYEGTYQNSYENNSENSNSSYNDINKF